MSIKLCISRSFPSLLNKAVFKKLYRKFASFLISMWENLSTGLLLANINSIEFSEHSVNGCEEPPGPASYQFCKITLNSKYCEKICCMILGNNYSVVACIVRVMLDCKNSLFGEFFLTAEN